MLDNDDDDNDIQTSTPSSSSSKPASSHTHHKHKPVCKSDVKKNLPLLTLLCKANDEERKNVLKRIDEDGLGVICCCVHNALFNTKATIPRQHWQPIKDELQGKHKRKALHYISKFGNNPEKKRKLLVQNGGSLPLLLNHLLPQITAAVELDKERRRGSLS